MKTATHTLNILPLITSAVLGALLIIPLATFGIAHAQSDETLEVSTNGMTATASFTRSTPCTSYSLEWGDGENQEIGYDAEMCIQVLDEKTLRHTYEDAGDYTITLTMNGKTYEEEITVPGDELTFGLTDVASITSKWVDPSQLIADEEYYIYTITLKSGETIQVEAGGFTILEYRNQQFADAGYTGDVDALLALIEETPTDEPEDPTTGDTDSTDLYKQLIAVLESLIERMQQLLTMKR